MSFFKPGDFKDCGTHDDCVNWANHLLQERGVRVLAHQGPSTNGAESPVWIAKPWQDGDSTHEALLVCIEELPKKVCEHEPYQTNADIILPSLPAQYPEPEWACKHCGVKLKAKWEPLGDPSGEVAE